METTPSSRRAALSQKDNKSRMSSKERVMSGQLTDIELDEVLLKLKLKSLNETHESEQLKKDKKIDALELKNEELNVKIGDQADKIRQLDHSNTNKDETIGAMEKRLEELSRQKEQLHEEISKIKELYERSTEDNTSQSQKIQKLKSELEEVKKELKLILGQNEFFATLIKEVQEKQDERMQHMEDTMKYQFEQLRSVIEQKKENPAKPRGTEVHIGEARNVQIAFDSPNSKHLVEQPPKITPNRQLLPTSKRSLSYPN